MRTAVAVTFVALAVSLAVAAGPKVPGSKDTAAPATAAANNSSQDENLRLEGEKRFRSNCARCHTAPPRFAPRMMATIVRHMRVRANITDEEMRLILRYMME